MTRLGGELSIKEKLSQFKTESKKSLLRASTSVRSNSKSLIEEDDDED